MEKEKRDTGRVPKRLFVRFGQDLPEHIGFTGDISLTGIFIKATKLFVPGSLLIIELTLPSGRIINLTGRVMWAKRVPPNLLRFVKKSGMGIRLEPVPEDFHQFIKTLS